MQYKHGLIKVFSLWHPCGTENRKKLQINAMDKSPCDPSFLSSSLSLVPPSILPSLASPSSASSSFTKGYPRQILGIAPLEIDPNYLCGHCEELLRDPVQASCGHRFCQICLDRLIEGSCSCLATPCVKWFVWTTLHSLFVTSSHCLCHIGLRF